MAKDLKVKLQLSVNDKASQPMAQASKNARKALKEVGEQAKSSAKTQQKAVETTAQKTEQANKKAQSTLKQTAQQATQSAATEKQASEQAARSYEQKAIRAQMASRRLKSAKETLDIRTEREIRAEIRQTMQAYQMLARSGTASARDLARAYERVKNKVRELNKEMGKHPAGQRLGDIGRGAMGVVGGIVAAKHLITPAMDDRKQWEANVTNVALQAFGDKDKAYIQNEGVNQIRQSVLDTVRNVGGTHDQALGNLNAMMVNGMSFEQANAMLGQAQKMQVAGEADANDIGALIKVLSDYGFKGDELVIAFEHALRSGMDGKFEIKDMVGSLPDILATAANAGFKGMKDFDYILAWLQSSADKAGSNSEAANNVKNTLNKMTADDTIKRFKKIENPFVKGRVIDLEQSLLEGKARGKNPVEVVTEIAEAMLADSKKYQGLQRQFHSAKTEDAKQQIEAQMNLMKGFVLSRLLPDVQAKAGLNAATDKAAMRDRLTNMDAQLTGGLNNKRFEIISETDQAVEARAKSLTFLGEKASGSLAGLERHFNDWKINMATENPELFSALSSVTTAFQAVAAGAGVAAVALWGLGGREGVESLKDMFGRRSPTHPTGGRIPPPRRIGSVGGLAGGKWLSGASKVLGAASIASVAMELGERQPYEQAKSEALAEKQSEAKAQFAKGYASNSPKAMGFAYGSFPLGVNSKGVPLYGGYALAHLNQDDQVAKARYELGSYNETQYQQRLARNATMREQYTTPKTAQTRESATQALGQLALSLAETTLQQGVMQGQLDSVTTTLSQYQADFAAFGQQISDSLQSGLAAQSHTIDNRITVELDGRVIAENSSQHFFTMANRG